MDTYVESEMSPETPTGILTVTLFAVLALTVAWLACAIASVLIAKTRGGNPLQWIVLGLLLGPIGLGLVLKLAVSCPCCESKVLRSVRTCPSCSKTIPVLASGDNPPGPLWTYRRDW